MQSLLLLLSGLALLIFGATLLDCGLSRLARRAGIPRLIAGAILTAYAAAAPTLTTGVMAGFRGQVEFAVGVIFGAYICNLLFLLGLLALISPVRVVYRMVRGNVPFMIFVAGLVWLFALNGRITLIENLALLLLVPAYTAFVVHYARRIPSGDHEPGSLPTPPQKNTVAIPVLVACLGGCAVFLYFGAQLLLTGALDLARLTGMDELAVGLAVAGPGLSLPVLVASFRTGRRGERNLVAGNVVSGNVFILLCVLSLTGFAASGALPVGGALHDLELPAAFVIAVICMPVFVTRAVINRLEGACFLLFYALYILLTVLRAITSPLYPVIANILFYILLPGTGLIVLLALWFAYYEVKILTADLGDDVADLAMTALKNTRKIVVSVVGVTLILVGIAMMALPGPATIVIPLGLALLSTEFLWAKRLLQYVRKEVEYAAARLTGTEKKE